LDLGIFNLNILYLKSTCNLHDFFKSDMLNFSCNLEVSTKNCTSKFMGEIESNIMTDCASLAEPSQTTVHPKNDHIFLVHVLGVSP
jgi:hypothetical protein